MISYKVGTKILILVANLLLHLINGDQADGNDATTPATTEMGNTTAADTDNINMCYGSLETCTDARSSNSSLGDQADGNDATTPATTEMGNITAADFKTGVDESAVLSLLINLLSKHHKTHDTATEGHWRNVPWVNGSNYWGASYNDSAESSSENQSYNYAYSGQLVPAYSDQLRESFLEVARPDVQCKPPPQMKLLTELEKSANNLLSHAAMYGPEKETQELHTILNQASHPRFSNPDAARLDPDITCAKVLKQNLTWFNDTFKTTTKEMIKDLKSLKEFVETKETEGFQAHQQLTVNVTSEQHAMENRLKRKLDEVKAVILERIQSFLVMIVTRHNSESWKRNQDCGDVYKNGWSSPGVYAIEQESILPILVWCESGWTVLTRFQIGDTSFDRSWREYASGFGDPHGDYWLGLNPRADLTKSHNYAARFELVERGDPEVKWFETTHYSVVLDQGNYTLNIIGISISHRIYNQQLIEANLDGTKFKFQYKPSQGCSTTVFTGWWHSCKSFHMLPVSKQNGGCEPACATFADMTLRSFKVKIKQTRRTRKLLG